MPTYEYRCRKCKRAFEAVMAMTEHEKHPRPSCPRCKSRSVEQLPAQFQAVTPKKT
jgi:putative FmdB family regulatory protein